VTASAAAAPSGSVFGGGTTGLHPLFTDGPFTIVGQCIVGSGGTNSVAAETFITSSDPHGSTGALDSAFAGEFPENNTSYFNSTTSPQEIVNDAGRNGGTLAAPVGDNPSTTGGDYEAQPESGHFAAISGDGKTALLGEVSNGVNIAGSDCVFAGSISKNA